MCSLLDFFKLLCCAMSQFKTCIFCSEMVQKKKAAFVEKKYNGAMIQAPFGGMKHGNPVIQLKQHWKRTSRHHSWVPNFIISSHCITFAKASDRHRIYKLYNTIKSTATRLLLCWNMPVWLKMDRNIIKGLKIKGATKWI